MTARHRRADLSVAEIRQIGQPDAVRSRANAEHWSAAIYWRAVSPYLTKAFLRAGISANGVTVLVILTGWAAAASLLIPGLLGPVLAAAFAQLQMLVDASDGEVARVNQTQGPRGIFLDKIAHYTTEGAIPVALGVRLWWEMDSPVPLVLGLVLGWFILVNKAMNDAVHVARSGAGLDRLPDSKAQRAIGNPVMSGLRRAAGLVPLHRAFHSVELTHIILLAALATLVAPVDVVWWTLIVLTVASPVVLAGHVLAILASNKLRMP